MRNNHHNHNKVPPFKPDPEHWTKKVHSWKAKVAYETEDDACGDIIPLVYTCKDCFFFKDGVFAIIPRRRDTHRKKILHVEISSTKRL